MYALLHRLECRIVVGSCRPRTTFYMVQENLAKFGLHAGNKELGEDAISICAMHKNQQNAHFYINVLI